MILAFWVGLLLSTADLSGQVPVSESGSSASPTGETGLSKKEIRRRRRAARRAAREAGREFEGSDAEDDAEEAAEAAAEQSRERASRKAAGMAENLKGGFGAGLEAAAAAPGGPEAGTAGGPPSTASFETPAGRLAHSPAYAPALDKAGLRPGPDGRSLVRISDGRPAQAADMNRLKIAIEAMPAALSLRPDFFSHVSKEHFSELKAGYHERPELADSVYRHVAPTEKDRDLIHSQSCSKVSGGCNESVRRDSYKKGEFVAPEDLERMWKSLEEKLEEDESADGPTRLSGPRLSAKRTGASAPPAFLETGSLSSGLEGGKEAGGSSVAGNPAADDSKRGASLLRRIFGPKAPAGEGGSNPGRRLWPLAVVILLAAGALLLRKSRP